MRLAPVSYFWNLLIGDCEDPAEIFLREAYLGAPVPDAFADMSVDAGVRPVFFAGIVPIPNPHGLIHSILLRLAGCEVDHMRTCLFMTLGNSIYGCVTSSPGISKVFGEMARSIAGARDWTALPGSGIRCAGVGVPRWAARKRKDICP